MDVFQGYYKLEPFDCRYFSAFFLVLRFIVAVACCSGSVLEWLGRIINSVITELPNTLTTPPICVNLIGRNIRYAH